MHGKEKVISPLMEQELKVSCRVIEGLNTDKFGAFSGEYERSGTPLEVARKKAEAALDLSKYNLAFSSEGSFGPHPSLGFIPADEEIVFLLDKLHKLEFKGYYLTEHTNFSHLEVQAIEEVKSFCDQAGFPEHGIILKASKADTVTLIYKDLTSFGQLESKTDEYLKKGYSIQLETDMRAMRNPTRMEAIRHATLNLIEGLKSECPNCSFPGFSISDVERGLECELCQRPTRLVKAQLFSCQNCDYKEKRSTEQEYADAMYCDFCNP